MKNNNKKILKLTTLVFSLFFSGHFVSAEALNLPKDAQGWTIFTPSADTRIMYVAADGNDSTAQIYSSTSQEVGSDPFKPSGVIQPYATYAAAYLHARAGYPDWILFKRGDTFYQAINHQEQNGRSTSEPFLIGSYGSTGTPPLLKVGASTAGISISKTSPSTPSTAQFISISGLTLYAYTRNPSDPEYIGEAGASGIDIITTGTANKIKNVLVEGCKFMYFANNSVQGGGTEFVDDVTIRKSVFLDNYPSGTERAQGLYGYRLNNFILEENIFDHNGWYSVSGSGGIGQGSIFDHNTYFGYSTNTTFRNNIFSRPSNMNNKFTSEVLTENLTVENNLYIDGHIGIGIETNYLTVDDRLKNITIKENVMTNLGRTNITGQNIAWYMQVCGWHGGVISNNLLMNQANPLITDTALGFQVLGNNEYVTINNNIVHDLQGGSIFKLYQTDSDIQITNNKISLPNGGSKTFSIDTNVSGYSLSANKYYTPTTTSFYFNTSNQAFSAWQSYSGDSSTFEQTTFPDPTRLIETYMSSIGETSTIDAFVEKVRSQDRFNWDTRLTADTVNDYLKAGFVSDDTTPPAAPTGLSVL